MKKLRILFLNPPSLDGRLINRHIMDPHVSKGAYLYPPYDLLLLSGWFYPSDKYELRIIDAMAEKKDKEYTISEIVDWKPDFILAQTAPQSFTLDMEFLSELKGHCQSVLFTAGAVEHARREKILDKYDWLDGILIEPISKDLYNYLEGDAGPFKTLLIRDKESLEIGRHREKWFELPACRHDLIDSTLYSYPAMRTDRFTSILTSYGCPFTCTYCEAPGFKFTKRKPEAVINELELIKRCGIQEVCFKDWTFAADKKHANQILDEMIKRNMDISWFTFSRADVLDRELIRKMKQAGCTTIQMGVETVNSDILKIYKRNSDNQMLYDIFTICREEGVETMGTFILGLPGDKEEDILRTIDFVLKLNPDYASFNIVTPLLGSELRKEWEEKGLIDSDQYEQQDSTKAGLNHLGISPTRLIELRDKAVKKFYFRPQYILRRLLCMRSYAQLKAHMKTGWSLFKEHLLKPLTNSWSS